MRLRSLILSCALPALLATFMVASSANALTIYSVLTPAVDESSGRGGEIGSVNIDRNSLRMAVGWRNLTSRATELGIYLEGASDPLKSWELRPAKSGLFTGAWRNISDEFISELLAGNWYLAISTVEYDPELIGRVIPIGRVLPRVGSRESHPTPEPAGFAVFAIGTGIVGAAVRKRAARG